MPIGYKPCSQIRESYFHKFQFSYCFQSGKVQAAYCNVTRYWRLWPEFLKFEPPDPRSATARQILKKHSSTITPDPKTDDKTRQSRRGEDSKAKLKHIDLHCQPVWKSVISGIDIYQHVQMEFICSNTILTLNLAGASSFPFGVVRILDGIRH